MRHQFCSGGFMQREVDCIKLNMVTRHFLCPNHPYLQDLLKPSNYVPAREFGQHFPSARCKFGFHQPRRSVQLQLPANA
jgi:hypothetical protein